MADELDTIINEPSDSQKRITELSGKVREQAEQKEAAQRSQQEAEAKTAEATRERDFYAGFSDIVATNPAAKDFKDDIKTKVLSGYSVEDATFAVLGKAGKLGSQEPDRSSPAGGSAATQLPDAGEKSPREMAQSERRAALMEAETRGDLTLS